MQSILLVEDNEMNRDMLSRRLARRGYHVLLALDGGEAVAAAAEHLPAVILMDMSLPVMDGWEATRRIKANPVTAHIPIIALTAHALPAERARALEAGCCAFETKPIDFPRLLSLLQTIGNSHASGTT